ncbi:MAG: hypothetical protein ACRDZO_25955 [Egibacteraceae bacterium]
MLAGVAGVLATIALGLALHATSTNLPGVDPALRQIDLLYLDEPAPLVQQLRIQPGRPALIVICEGCEVPPADAQVRVTDDLEVARAYALARGDVAGPGYAIVDPQGQVRYRTFDPGLASHGEEVRVLLDAVR